MMIARLEMDRDKANQYMSTNIVVTEGQDTVLINAAPQSQTSEL